jgi:hypothetical protein
MSAIEQRARVMQLVVTAIDPKLGDSQLADVLDELERLVPHPDIGALIFSEEPELTPEEIVERALSYVPPALPR